MIDDQIMLITGTSSGIGQYLAKYYLEKGYMVIGCSRSQKTIEHEHYTHFIADISNEDDIIDIFRHIRKLHKRLDVLINNAAVNPAIINVAMTPFANIQQVFKINVFAPIVFCREAIKLMIRNKYGRIINLGSMATRHEVNGESLYTSSKAAINAFTRVLAKETGGLNITANVVAPSAIKTKLSDAINQEELAKVLDRNAIRQFGEFDDVSSCVDYLIRQESRSITGQIIYLGGA